MQMPKAAESVGDSEGQSESQFAVSKNTLQEGFHLQLVGLQF